MDPKTVWFKFGMATAIFQRINPAHSIADHYSFQIFFPFSCFLRFYLSYLLPSLFAACFAAFILCSFPSLDFSVFASFQASFIPFFLPSFPSPSLPRPPPARPPPAPPSALLLLQTSSGTKRPTVRRRRFGSSWRTLTLKWFCTRSTSCSRASSPPTITSSSSSSPSSNRYRRRSIRVMMSY